MVLVLSGGSRAFSQVNCLSSMAINISHRAGRDCRYRIPAPKLLNILR